MRWEPRKESTRMSWNSTSFSNRQVRTRATSADAGDPNTFTGIFSGAGGSAAAKGSRKRSTKNLLAAGYVANAVLCEGLDVLVAIYTHPKAREGVP